MRTRRTIDNGYEFLEAFCSTTTAKTAEELAAGSGLDLEAVNSFLTKHPKTFLSAGPRTVRGISSDTGVPLAVVRRYLREYPEVFKRWYLAPGGVQLFSLTDKAQKQLQFVQWAGSGADKETTQKYYKKFMEEIDLLRTSGNKIPSLRGKQLRKSTEIPDGLPKKYTMNSTFNTHDIMHSPVEKTINMIDKILSGERLFSM